MIVSMKHILNVILNIGQWTKSPSKEWSHVALFICRDVCPSVWHIYLREKIIISLAYGITAYNSSK